MKYVFCKGRGLSTTKNICNLVGINRLKEFTGKRTRRTLFKLNTTTERVAPLASVIVNWATTNRYFGNSIVYNTVDAIKRASNKAGARIALMGSGIPTPKTKLVGELLNGMTFPVVARPPYHYGGKGFTYCETIEDYQRLFENGTIQAGWYVSEYFDKNAEYRVHVAHGKVLAVQKKVREDGRDAAEFKVWNHCESGFRFRPVEWSLCDKELIKIAIKASQVIGLDFSAIDIMAKETDSAKTYSVCELNTSPALKDYMLKKYANYFKWLFESDEKREHFNVLEEEKVSKMFWKFEE